jgi:hypothetical protein
MNLFNAFVKENTTYTEELILPQLGFRVYIMIIVLFEQLTLTLQGYFELYKLKISSFQGKNNLEVYLE